MKKIVRVGTTKVSEGRYTPLFASVFCKIEIKDTGELSISGVVGPKANGNALGSCGQINMGFAHRNPAHNDVRYPNPATIETFAPGWTLEKWYDFLDVWNRWHLNYMKAGTPTQEAELCKHVFPGYPLDHYKWALQTLSNVGPFTVWAHPDMTPEKDAQFWAAALTDKIFRGRAKVRATYAEFTEREAAQAYANMIKDENAPEVRGLECDNGYTYGSKWLKAELPADVISFLESLPVADINPAWV